MNRTGFDMSAVGNHEFDSNVTGLQEDINRAHFPFLCANVVVPVTVDLDVKPFVTIERQGVKIAVVGMLEVGHDGIPSAHPNNVAKVSFIRPSKATPMYKYLRDENDVVILLSHCGLEDDMELAQANPWLDAIIGGHTHTLIEKPSETNGVLVTQAGSHLKYATLMKLTVKDHKVIRKEAVVLDVNKVRKVNAEIKNLVNGFNDTPALNQPLATALTKFDNQEELGCMITDAIREVSGADFAFQNPGGIRANHLKKGPITLKDVYSVDPFNNEVVVYQMTGEQVKKFILNSYRKNGGNPSFVSGMTYTVSDDGRNVWINMEGDNFSTKKTYKVAFNSFMASTVIIESVDEGRSTFMTSEEMLIEFLKRHKTVDYQGVARTK
jgi:5'-nucleotidase